MESSPPISASASSRRLKPVCGSASPSSGLQTSTVGVLGQSLFSPALLDAIKGRSRQYRAQSPRRGSKPGKWRDFVE